MTDSLAVDSNPQFPLCSPARCPRGRADHGSRLRGAAPPPPPPPPRHPARPSPALSSTLAEAEPRGRWERSPEPLPARMLKQLLCPCSSREAFLDLFRSTRFGLHLARVGLAASRGDVTPEPPAPEPQISDCVRVPSFCRPQKRGLSSHRGGHHRAAHGATVQCSRTRGRGRAGQGGLLRCPAGTPCHFPLSPALGWDGRGGSWGRGLEVGCASVLGRGAPVGPRRCVSLFPKPEVRGPRGLMDKASDFGSED